jgi:hypothetical protein
MNDPTRREFLEVAGCAIASSSRAVADERASRSLITHADKPRIDQVPPHQPLAIEGVHAYTDRISVAAGETVRFHVSSSCPYELQVCRLGLDVDGPDRDQVLHSFGQSPAAVQPIHPGSYIVAKGLEPAAEMLGLSLELWIRRWRTTGRQAIITQYDEPSACGFGLFVNEDGSLSFYTGDGQAYDPLNMLTSAPDQVKMAVNPLGLKTFPDNTPSSVLSNQWHHVVARFDGKTKQIWVDGREVASGKRAVPLRPGTAPLRIGAAGKSGLAATFLDADLAMPAIYCKALTPDEIRARFQAEALTRPRDSQLLACWPLNEERGDQASDCSVHRRDARIINHGTWMIGGPSFNADVPRFSSYDPAKDPRRGHGIRLASDDLFACRWRATHSFRLPLDARSGIYCGRIRFHLEGEPRLYHTVFIVRKAASRPRAAIAFLCSTNTW